jgi:acyl carrier protein
MEDIKQIVKEYILDELLPGEDPAQLNDSVQLVKSGILDSIATLKLVAFLEERFQLELQAHEINLDNFNTLPEIAAIVERKKKG